MVGETGIRIIAAFVFLCGISVTAAFTISQYNRQDAGSATIEAATLIPEAANQVNAPLMSKDVEEISLKNSDFEKLDFNSHYPRFLTALENDAPETTQWRKIWMSNPADSAPDGLGDYDEDYSKMSSIEDGSMSAL